MRRTKRQAVPEKYEYEQAIKDLVDHFTDSITEVIARARNESLAYAMQIIESGHRTQTVRTTRSSTATAERPVRRVPAVRPPRRLPPTVIAAGIDAGNGTAALVGSRANGHAEPNGIARHTAFDGSVPRRRTGVRVVAMPRAVREIVPVEVDAFDAGSASEASVDVAEREASVLDAVRFLVRATAAEISSRCRLPNNAVYIVLRSLVANGSVAKTETGRGIEYSLVSKGAIRPFKRAGAGLGTAVLDAPPPAAAVETLASTTEIAAAV